jgi:hypothetical protein
MPLGLMASGDRVGFAGPTGYVTGETCAPVLSE